MTHNEVSSYLQCRGISAKGSKWEIWFESDWNVKEYQFKISTNWASGLSICVKSHYSFAATACEICRIHIIGQMWVTLCHDLSCLMKMALRRLWKSYNFNNKTDLFAISNWSKKAISLICISLNINDTVTHNGISSDLEHHMNGSMWGVWFKSDWWIWEFD